MKCPNCSRDILDTAIICPYCNTQFAFTTPSAITNQNSNLYEVVEQDVPMPAPKEIGLPTEVNYNNEEEINPDEMTYYVDKNNNGIIEEDEIMHIYGRPIEINQDVPIDPMNMTGINPIRPEAPNNPQPVVTNQVVNQNTMVNQQAGAPVINPGVLGTPQPMESPPVINTLPTSGQIIGENNMNQQSVSVSPSPPVVEQPTTEGITPNSEFKSSNPMNAGNLAHTVKNTSPTIGTAAVRTANLIPESGEINLEIKKDLVDTNSYLKQKKKKDEMFFMIVIVVGMIVLVILILLMIIGTNKKKELQDEVTNKTKTTTQVIDSKNIGHKSTFNYPLYVGNTAVASYYDSNKKLYTDVDITGIRFIDGEEASELAANYSKDKLNEGFEWYGFEYKVQFNDLEYLKDSDVNPIMQSKIYKWNGCDFVTYNEKNYFIKIQDIYNGKKIKNGESATVKVVYQLPPTEKQYSICLGDIDKTIGCFTNEKVE